MAGWEYSTKSRRYRDPSGKFVSMTTVRRMRDAIATSQADTLAGLATRMLAGELTGPAFVMAMRHEVKRMTLLQYMLGRGGRQAMTAADRGRVGALCKAQYTYINGFADAMMNGELSEAQATARARMYGGATTGAFERGHAAAFGIRLPKYPGETQCAANCRCRWRIEEQTDRVECTWLLDPGADHCSDCLTAAADYAPHTIERTSQ